MGQTAAVWSRVARNCAWTGETTRSSGARSTRPRVRPPHWTSPRMPEKKSRRMRSFRQDRMTGFSRQRLQKGRMKRRSARGGPPPLLFPLRQRHGHPLAAPVTRTRSRLLLKPEVNPATYTPRMMLTLFAGFHEPAGRIGFSIHTRAPCLGGVYPLARAPAHSETNPRANTARNPSGAERRRASSVLYGEAGPRRWALSAL